MTTYPLRRSLATVLAASLAGPLAPAPVTAGVGPDLARDGVVSPDNCRAVGIDLAQPRPEVYRGRVAATGGARAMTGPMPPPPPPPPPPPAPMAAQTADVIVSASRMRGEAAYVPPPATVARDTERYPDATPNPVKRVADEPVSTFSIDVDTASYSNVRRFIEEGRRP
ncbi:MAG: von Willebrand factor type A domain-containing protein, partial [Alphaproteobacteria bacterium]|nr:von Willebrand factor type A domain-containing protein [Alphaproteobacteria bacterium]